MKQRVLEGEKQKSVLHFFIIKSNSCLYNSSHLLFIFAPS